MLDKLEAMIVELEQQDELRRIHIERTNQMIIEWNIEYENIKQLVNRRRYILNSGQYTINSKPYTLNPIP